MTRKLALSFTFLFCFFILFKGPWDPDFGWHYKYGEYTVEHREVLKQNIFSYTFQDYAWANSYWIPQVVFYTLASKFGYVFFSMVMALASATLVVRFVLALAKKVGSGFILFLLMTCLLASGLSITSFSVRPLFFSTLYFMFLLWFLLSIKVDGARKDYLKLLAIPVLFLIWANSHADFTIGLFAFGLFTLENIFFHLTATSKPRSLTKILLLFVIGGSALLVTLINPFGVELWTTLLKETHAFQFNHIAEWVPVSTNNMPYFVYYCTLLGLSTFSLISVRRKLPLWYLILNVALLIMAVRSQYFIRLVLFVSTYPILLYWSGFIAEIRPFLPSYLVKSIKKGLIALLAISVLMGAGLFFDRMAVVLKFVQFQESEDLPIKALEYAQKEGISGKVFNLYGWGGFMIWQFPQYKTFVDGRMPSWRYDDNSVFEDYINITKSPKKYAHLLEEYNVNWILFPPDDAFSKYLESQDVIWEKTYTDEAAAIFLRRR